MGSRPFGQINDSRSPKAPAVKLATGSMATGRCRHGTGVQAEANHRPSSTQARPRGDMRLTHAHLGG